LLFDVQSTSWCCHILTGTTGLFLDLMYLMNCVLPFLVKGSLFFSRIRVHQFVFVYVFIVDCFISDNMVYIKHCGGGGSGANGHLPGFSLCLIFGCWKIFFVDKFFSGNAKFCNKR